MKIITRHPPICTDWSHMLEVALMFEAHLSVDENAEDSATHGWERAEQLHIDGACPICDPPPRVLAGVVGLRAVATPC